MIARNEPSPDFPPGFVPPPVHSQEVPPQGTVTPLTIYPNMSSQQASQPQEVQFPPYGLPPGYTPPFAGGPTDSNPPATVQANFVQTQGAFTGTVDGQNAQAHVQLTPLVTGYVPPLNTNQQETHVNQMPLHTNQQNFLPPQNLSTQGNLPTPHGAAMYQSPLLSHQDASYVSVTLAHPPWLVAFLPKSEASL